MELLVGARVALTPRPLQRREAALETAMLGHCPGRVRLDRLLTLSGTLDDMRSVGYGAAVSALNGLQQLLAQLRLYGASPDIVQAAMTLASRRADLRATDLSTDILSDNFSLAEPLDDDTIALLQGNGFTDLATALTTLHGWLQEFTSDEWLTDYDELTAGVRLRGNATRAHHAAEALFQHHQGLRNAGFTNPLLLIDSSLAQTLPSLRTAGFASLSAAVTHLHDWWQVLKGLTTTAVQALNQDVGSLYQLPLPLRSRAEFHDIFPDAAQTPCRYESVLAGRHAWLPQAIDDFFANGGEKLWVVRVPEFRGVNDEGQQYFLPAEDTKLHDVDTLTGIATVLAIPSVAVVALPDLERLQIPAKLPDIPRNRLLNPDPQFLPSNQSLDDDHRERRYGGEIANALAPRALPDLLRHLLRFIANDNTDIEQRRPDVQLLFSMPLSYSPALDSPALDPAGVTSLQAIRDGSAGHWLRHVQFLFPYLRGANAGRDTGNNTDQSNMKLRSPVGAIAGMQAGVARRFGPWRSMAAQPLLTDALPYPRLAQAQVVQLREEPGIGVLHSRNGRVYLDDERLVVPALPPSDYAGSSDRHRYDGFRAGEVMRFLGFLRRQLRALGDVLVFNSDFRDPRPRLLLEQFFRRLHAQGALRGALPEHAFTIQPGHAQEGALAFDIQIAPAFPIDRLTLTFANLGGEWQLEVTSV